MNATPFPTTVEPNNDTSLRLGWSDGRAFVVPYLELRYLCPCASCVDEHSGQRMIRREDVDPAVRPRNVRLVGRYALQFDWSDRHETGMYGFDRLREACEKFGAPIAPESQ